MASSSFHFISLGSLFLFLESWYSFSFEDLGMHAGMGGTGIGAQSLWCAETGVWGRIWRNTCRGWESDMRHGVHCRKGREMLFNLYFFFWLHFLWIHDLT
ncbi:hypothetical protein B0J18DRAFT_283090 [Chaetomium sp. MPI-SDFR-AT-0129]|nr:hypothetical protein B0J18DRAFT_283090 [Chaetomium sp. MPI-SDFR-AT-0129]